MTINDVQRKRMMCLREIGNSNIRLLSFGRFAASMSFPKLLSRLSFTKIDISNNSLLRLF